MKEGLATALNAGSYDNYDTFCEFEVNIDLTSKGIQEINRIIGLTIHYINNIKANGIQEWIFKELQLTNKLKFDYMDKKRGMMETAKMAKMLHTRKIE